MFLNNFHSNRSRDHFLFSITQQFLISHKKLQILMRSFIISRINERFKLFPRNI